MRGSTRPRTNWRDSIRSPMFERRLIRAAIAAVLALALASPHSVSAQDAAATEAGGSPLAGSFEGWAKLTNEWAGQLCHYDAGPDATTVHLELNEDAGRLRGSLALDVPAATEAGCPPLRKRYVIAEADAGPGTLTFTDSGGNEWTLGVRHSASVLQGLMAWRQGGPDQPLAEGASGDRRLVARLSGEVHLRRIEAQVKPPAAASAPPKAGAGTHLRNLGIVLGANIVGLGLLYGVNRIGEGSVSSGAVSCSPRVCNVGLPGAPCFCEGATVAGGPCGDTASGQGIGQPCALPATPCQEGASCNSSFCEDQTGRCPW
jgi:hypothetical protein